MNIKINHVKARLTTLRLRSNCFDCVLTMKYPEIFHKKEIILFTHTSNAKLFIFFDNVPLMT